MNSRRRRHRLVMMWLSAATALSPVPVLAQAPSPTVSAPAGQGTLPPGDQNSAAVRVPDRVGRISKVDGSVSWHGADADHWDTAAPNLPVSAGDAFWTQPGARAQLEIDADALAMNDATELDINQLDQQTFVATEPQGEVLIHVAGLQQNESWTVQTPRGLITLKSAGCYVIAAGDTEHPTQVSVIDGAADISGTNVGLQVGKNQTAVIEGTTSFTGRVETLRNEDFLQQGAAALCQPLQPQGTVPPAAVLSMSGGTDLATYGSWGDVAEYGAVWYPPVDASWAPYRHGYWGYVGDWGWTWIDNEPWGFAPFHYGRWAQLNGRWAWIPGAYGNEQHPAYAPALVSFFDTTGAPLAAGAAAGAIAAGLVAWVPLGPHEPYYPWFHAQPGYVRSVNRPYIRNVAEVVNRYQDRSYVRTLQLNQFVNRGAVTVVPGAVMAFSRPVAAMAEPIGPDRLAGFRPSAEHLPVLPTAGAVGLTGGLATRLHIPGGAAAVAAAHTAAPGPQFHPGQGQAVSPVALRPPAVRAAARPAAPIVGFGPEHRPALPPLAGPGAHPPVAIAAEPKPGLEHGGPAAEDRRFFASGPRPGPIGHPPSVAALTPSPEAGRPGPRGEDLRVMGPGTGQPQNHRTPAEARAAPGPDLGRAGLEAEHPRAVAPSLGQPEQRRPQAETFRVPGPAPHPAPAERGPVEALHVPHPAPMPAPRGPAAAAIPQDAFRPFPPHVPVQAPNLEVHAAAGRPPRPGPERNKP